MFRIEILTIFPQIFDSFLATSLIQKAIARNLLSINCKNIRDFADAPHFKVDDEPYGGGAGMLMKPEPLYRAILDAKTRLPNAPVILLSASGQLFNQTKAQELNQHNELILVCGRYEGVDQRVIDLLVDLELSIGDYVLMGGEAPAMVLVEAIARLKPNIIGNEQSLNSESFAATEQAPSSQAATLLEAPQYTRPAEFEGHSVPATLLGGDHSKILEWRKQQSIERTKKNRPDLLK